MQPLYSEHPVMFRNHPFLFVLSLALVFVGVGLVIFLIWFLYNKASRLEVYPNEILFEKGLLSKERSEVSISSVRTVRVSQSFINRLLGVGTVEIFTAGDKPEFVARGLRDPNRVRELIKMGQGAKAA
jgi:uncharacterized membrane protein YdbT with pleckstrin-like domain